MFTLKLQKSQTKLFFCKMWHYRSQDDVSRTGIGLSKVLGMIYPPKTRQWKKSSYADKHCDVSCLAFVFYIWIFTNWTFLSPHIYISYLFLGDTHLNLYCSALAHIWWDLLEYHYYHHHHHCHHRHHHHHCEFDLDHYCFTVFDSTPKVYCNKSIPTGPKLYLRVSLWNVIFIASNIFIIIICRPCCFTKFHECVMYYLLFKFK